MPKILPEKPVWADLMANLFSAIPILILENQFIWHAFSSSDLATIGTGLKLHRPNGTQQAQQAQQAR